MKPGRFTPYPGLASFLKLRLQRDWHFGTSLASLTTSIDFDLDQPQEHPAEFRDADQVGEVIGQISLVSTAEEPLDETSADSVAPVH